ncbi:MAG: hypothetical protein JSW72_06615 [Candidatus Bathyarchaeota archaeon]|nr:MAG: hypothetical protein JSW72_06615 [Candidatus Bathyarchaeota archaeon]
MDKLEAGIDVAAFPQFRDMNQMFLTSFEGIEKLNEGYLETASLTLKPGQDHLPEVAAIQRNAARIHAEKGSPFQLRVCITGPYTLASFFPHRTSQIYLKLGKVLSMIVAKNIFAVRHGKVALITLDEPLFGLIDDPLIDKGVEGRENLLLTWEMLTSEAKRKNVETSLHLHSTSDDLFWSVGSLRIVESHVDDPLYRMPTTKRLLDKEDKSLKASIAITDFDQLIKTKIGLAASEDTIVNAWRKILSGTLNPAAFLESIDVMKKRLLKIIRRFGMERVAFGGPECGLRGFPTYTSAISCLNKVSKTVRSVNY